MTAPYRPRTNWRVMALALFMALPCPGRAEPSSTDILRAADEARGNVDGLAGRVAIESS